MSRELIRKDQDRQHLRHLLLEGAASAPGAVAMLRISKGCATKCDKRARKAGVGDVKACHPTVANQLGCRYRHRVLP